MGEKFTHFENVPFYSEKNWGYSFPKSGFGLIVMLSLKIPI
jgi:hypothetical protein